MARSALLALLLVVVAAAVHARVGAHGYLHEGDGVVTENPLVERGLSAEGLGALFDPGPFTTYGGDTPLARLVSMVVVEWFGEGPAAQHRTSALLHVLGALLLLAVLRRLRIDEGVALFVAFAFALHPMMVESVDWIAQRGRLLGVTFSLTSLWFWAGRREHPGGWRYGAALFAFLLGLLAHPFVAALPLVLLALSSRTATPLRALAPFLLLGAAGFVAAWVQAPASDLTPLARLAGAPLAVGFLAALLSGPFGLAYHYPHPALDVDDALPVVITAITALVLLASTVAALRRLDSWIAVGWLWFVGAAFVSVLLPYDVALGGDRDVYFASIGFFLCVGAGAQALARRIPALKASLPLAAGLAVIAWASLAVQRTDDWRASASLNARALDVTTDNAVALRNDARDLLWRGKLTAAGEELLLALARRPLDAESLLTQGDIAFHRARHAVAARRPDREARMLQEAERLYTRSAELAPERDEPLLRLGEISQRRGDEASLRRARERLAAAIERGPLRLESHQRLGLVQLGLLELEPARSALERAVELDPDGVPDGWCGLGLLAMQSGAYDDARKFFERTLAIEPDYVEARTNLGRIQLEAGEIEPAEENLLHATRVHPRFSDALYYLGRVYQVQGRIDEAITQFERTLRQEAGHIRANMGLAVLYAQKGLTAEARERANVVLERAGSPARQAEAHALLGRVALQTGDWDEARARFEGALALDPERLEDEVSLGLVLLRLGDTRAAEVLFRRLAQRAPEYPGVEYGLGQLAEVRDDYARAVGHFRTAMQQQPRSWIMANALARVLAAAPDDSVRDGVRALELARGCVSTTRRRSFEALETLASAQAELGSFEEATASQREAMRLVPEERREAMRARLVLYQAETAFRLGGEQ